MRRTGSAPTPRRRAAISRLPPKCSERGCSTMSPVSPVSPALTRRALLASAVTRRAMLVATAAAGAVGLVPAALHAASEGGEAIRPFRIAVPEADIADLRRRLAVTRWPDRERVPDDSQGV